MKSLAVKQKVKQIVTLLIPMFFISITRAEDLANAMEARGYVPSRKRTRYRQLKMTFKDYCLILLCFLVLLSTIGIMIWL